MKTNPLIFSKFLFLSALALVIFFACKSSPTVESVNYRPIASLRVCSQNVFRFSERNKRWSQAKQEKQAAFLITRMYKAKCDVVALQEVMGSTKEQAAIVASDLAFRLSKRTGFEFEAIVGGTRDRFMRNGILYRKDILAPRRIFDLSTMPLPRFQNIQGATGHFSRGPLLVHFELLSDSISKPDFLVATMHFKSKHSAYRDGYGSSFEVLRMEMADALHRRVREYVNDYDGKIVPVILGDRNSNSGSASAVVLKGERSLQSFRSAECELSEELTPLCSSRATRATFVALFEERSRVRGAGSRAMKGSHKYRGKESFIDDILVPPGDLGLITRESGTYAIGLVGQYFKGSDHKLLWAEFNTNKEPVAKAIGR